MKKWWQAWKNRRCYGANIALRVSEFHAPDHTYELSHTVKRWQRLVSVMRDRSEIDHDVADACRHLLWHAELLVPYALVMPQPLCTRIVHIVGEDIPRLLTPYAALPEEVRRRQSRTLLRGIRILVEESRRIIQSIQQYETDAFSSEARLVQAWYGESHTE
ncbi:hypothetical protein DFP93_12347 [Aneurinibacillus soli]|uniref:Uncharacterized protein n=1 Tax=Aneurinibacillus soli TaxID=1500254 RepID=A0A0U5B0I9_9BACL|nr:hypothetical protein [Aneurinibacillus soli]PYE58501.1 hypothetical protein DFP93_12347 [Aneurinibacillus soli]BAU29477.1 hypothetical protein CB4_03677 [Aneurinibacillus soli]